MCSPVCILILRRHTHDSPGPTWHVKNENKKIEIQYLKPPIIIVQKVAKILGFHFGYHIILLRERDSWILIDDT